MVEVIFALLVPILLLGGAFVGLIAVLARRSRRDIGTTLRRFFQQGMLLTLVILVATGVSGLLSAADPDVVAGPGYLAFMLACVIVGGPALHLAARRERRRGDRHERPGFGGDGYLVLAELISLVTAATGLSLWGESLLEGRFDIAPAVVALVWGTVWVLHHRLAGLRGRTGGLAYGVLAGSLIGLATGAVFGVLILTSIFERAYDSVTGVAVLARGTGALRQPLVELVVAGAIWLRYWAMLGQHLERSTAWRAYVLLAGVVGGLFTALSGVWNLAYLSLDWWFGDPIGPAGLHFRELPVTLALIIVGGAAWRYHDAVMRSAAPDERAEVDRAHDYLVAGVGLVATVGGAAAVLAAVIQALTPATVLYPSDRSELVGAVTVLLVGAPLWWRHWTKIQQFRNERPPVEVASPTRRIYLIAVFGLGGAVALVSLLVLVYSALEQILGSGTGTEVVLAVRWPLALAATVGITAAYHRTVRRTDLLEAPDPETGRQVPPEARSLTLVARDSGPVAEALAQQTAVRVRYLERTDGQGRPLALDEVLELLHDHPESHLLIVSGEDGVGIIPYEG
ncbi:MAG: DUF5671 domain-containing protein [bacterium]|nr:DUF5671 domain-containing protein [bacterium]MDE0351259.1 DUF5671 domain-containing protein [bacterium]